MDINTILDIVYGFIGFLMVGIPSLIKIIKDKKALKQAKTKEEENAAKEDMRNQLEVFIKAAEIAYKDVNETLKAKGSSAGPIKKDSVLIKLQNYATEKGYDFDTEFWSNENDRIVELTKNVNK